MTITKEKTVAEIVASHMGSDFVFSKYKIDFCCGGGATMSTASEESGVTFEDLKNEIEAITANISGKVDLNKMNLKTLVKKIKNEYFNFFDENLKVLIPLASKVAEVHGQSHSELIDINILVRGAGFVLSEMVENSKTKLIPFMEKYGDFESKLSDIQLHEFEKIIHTNEVSQKLLDDSFKEIKKLSSGYEISTDACNSYKLLYEKIQEFDHQFHKYVHLERNLLIPKVLKKYHN